MSYYYCYYAGIEDSDGKIKPLGPYNCEGELKSIIERSRSFASDLHEDFYPIPEEKISDELRKEFEYENWDGQKVVDVKYLPITELTQKDYIVTGYFLIEDLQTWEQCGDDSLFYSVIDSHKYAELLKKELIFGKNKPEKDKDGYEYTPPNASDYMYSAVPNYSSKEYEAMMIREVAEMLFSYELSHKYKLVILETEG